MVDKETFVANERIRVECLFQAKHRPGFRNKGELASWYIEKLVEQDFRCYYCDTSIFDIRQLIDNELLLTRKTGYGRRGPILEIDRIINPNGYNPINCVLSCYYCNNDKSSTLEGEVYKRFFGKARNSFFKHLLEARDLG